MYKRILVPIAIDHKERADVSVAAAKALAAPDAKITLINVHENMPAYVASMIPEATLEENRGAARATMTGVAEKFDGMADVAMISGHPARAIVDYAEEHGVDCIVIASHHPGVSDYFLGSTAAWVVRHADCSIHVIR